MENRKEVLHRYYLKKKMLIKQGLYKPDPIRQARAKHLRPIVHGHTKRGVNSRTYHSWYAMKQRCLYPKSNRYYRYGARGIKVCDRWVHSFQNFIDDMGVRPQDKTLDRINPDGNYEPSNCRWADSFTQCHNKANYA